MKKMILVVMVAIVAIEMSFSVVSAEEKYCRMGFPLEPGQVVQKMILFSFIVPSGCDTYLLRRSSFALEQRGGWEFISPGEYVSPYSSGGIYRFIGGSGASYINIVGSREETTFPKIGGGLTCEGDISLLVRNTWQQFEIGLLPRGDTTSCCGYFSYQLIWSGWGTSFPLANFKKVALPSDDSFDSRSRVIGFIVFDDTGFPQRLLKINAKALVNRWLNPGEIAVVIYREREWTKEDRAEFSDSVAVVNAILRSMAEEE